MLFNKFCFKKKYCLNIPITFKKIKFYKHELKINITRIPKLELEHVVYVIFTIFLCIK